MKVVLVNPPLSWEERYNIKLPAGGNTPPLGLACLAAVLRQRNHQVSLLDAAVLQLSSEETAAEILARNPEVVGFTAVTISIDKVIKIMRRIRLQAPAVRLILGGPHITAVPEETFGRFDILSLAVLGEGESTIIELLDFWSAKGKYPGLESIPGLAVRKNGKLFFTPKRERILKLDTLPYPAWDLLPDLSKYYTPPAHTVKRFPAALLVTSRGCTGQCIFCDRSIYGNRLTGYSAEYVLGMIRELQAKFGIKEIQFRDDNFVVFKKRLLEICQKIISEKIDLVWSCSGRLDQVDAEMLREMKKAGCWQIWYGVESGSDRVLEIGKKNISVRQIRETVELTNKAGISVCGFFILGHPGETEPDIKKTLDLLLELKIDDFHVSYMTPFPGTELYRRAKEFGSFENVWENLNGWLPMFIPYGLTARLLVKYSKKAFFRFYFRPRIIISYIIRVFRAGNVKIYFLGFLALLNWIFLPALKRKKRAGKNPPG